MKVKRGVWIASCIVSVVSGGAAVLLGYGILVDLDGALNNLSVRALMWPIVLILVAGMSAAGIFMSPQEYEEATKIEVDEEPAQWIKDMRRQEGADRED